MNTLLLLLRKDLLRRRRDPLSVLVMLAFPLVFAGIFALIFGSGGSTPQAELLVHNEDAWVGRVILGAFGSEQLSEIINVTEVGPEGRERIEQGDGSALLHIPENTTERLLDGEVVTFELIRNPSQTILPEIAEQVSAVLVDVLDLGAIFLQERRQQINLDEIEDFNELLGTDFDPLLLSMRRTFEAGERYFEAPPLELKIFDLDENGERILEVKTASASEEAGEEDEKQEQKEEQKEEEGSRTAAIFAFLLPGLAVYALFMIGDQMMRDVLTESEEGTLRRQLTAPITVRQIVLAKVLGAGIVGTLSLSILIGVLVTMTEVRFNIPGFIVLALSIVLAATGFATAVYGVVHNDRQGSTFSSLVILAFAFTGGTFLPFEQLPGAVQKIAPLSPFYWGISGFHDLFDGAVLVDILPSIGVLSGLGGALLLLGSSFLQRRMARGGAS